MVELHIPSPVQKIDDQLLLAHNVKLYVKRDDLIHPYISGNKWRKLKGYLDCKPKGIITFGGAFSNHIYSTAAAGYFYNIPTIGIIRGEIDEDNPTIKACRQWNMKLVSVSRSEYKLKDKGDTFVKLANECSEYIYVPEGGSGDLANVGLEEMAKEIPNTFDYIILAAGTGGTTRGLIRSTQDQKILVVSSLKGNDLYNEFGLTKSDNVEILDSYHHGGYGKVTTELLDFINNFKTKYSVSLDPIYNGKVVFAIYDMVQKQLLSNCSILWIHTGGLQGIDGYNYLANKKGKPTIES